MTTEADALRLASKRGEFEASLQRGLEMAPTEHATFGILEQALTMVANQLPADLLLADSSRAHFEKALGTPGHIERACDVTSPVDCPACTSGQLRLFEDNTSLDTCRFLRGRERVATICVPVSIGGQTIGVVRAQSPFGSASPATLTSELTLVARKAGERIGAQRVLAQTEEQAQSDPLTGLPNRRTFENQVDQRQLRNTPYVIAFADLDQFKLINDVHGHDVGDRALRIFAQVLRDAIRPGDLLARHGGEEFVVLLPNCPLPDARNVAERIRSQLARAVGHGSVPPFTVTIGLAKAGPSTPLSDVIASADGAMLMAKSLGRDRVFTANDAAMRNSTELQLSPPEVESLPPTHADPSTDIERSRGAA
jgi:diguanylate cyclase (GGDEF)-like protein